MGASGTRAEPGAGRVGVGGPAAGELGGVCHPPLVAGRAEGRRGAGGAGPEHVFSGRQAAGKGSRGRARRGRVPAWQGIGCRIAAPSVVLLEVSGSGQRLPYRDRREHAQGSGRQPLTLCPLCRVVVHSCFPSLPPCHPTQTQLVRREGILLVERGIQGNHGAPPWCPPSPRAGGARRSSRGRTSPRPSYRTRIIGALITSSPGRRTTSARPSAAPWTLPRASSRP